MKEEDNIDYRERETDTMLRQWLTICCFLCTIFSNLDSAKFIIFAFSHQSFPSLHLEQIWFLYHNRKPEINFSSYCKITLILGFLFFLWLFFFFLAYWDFFMLTLFQALIKLLLFLFPKRLEICLKSYFQSTSYTLLKILQFIRRFWFWEIFFWETQQKLVSINF